jgi:hypothetical protein
MAQGALPFKYEEEKSTTGMTALGGLPAYLDLAHVAGLSQLADRHLAVRTAGQGWTDGQIVTALVLLNLAGGDCVEDLKVLEADEGFCRVLRKARLHGLRQRARRKFARRWRKDKKRSVPSASTAFRYLSAFEDQQGQELRQSGKAYIPKANRHLRSFAKVNKNLLSFVQSNNRQATATLDMDATLLETAKKEALFCYKGFKSYQPFNTWWAEQGLVVHTEFRDGNVPAGYEQLRILKEALECLPERIDKVRLRSDTAGYQHDLLSYCETGKNERFGRIEFAIGSDVSPQFKQAVAEVPESDWQPLMKMVKGHEVDTGRQWAEVCFVPSAIGYSNKDPQYRYLAIREPMQEQLFLAGMQDKKDLSFPTMAMTGTKYKVFGIVTNMDWNGQELIHWLYKRCGKSEHAHGEMKKDLAGGKMPSKYFGENAAWWWIMILAFNLNAAMKMLVLGKAWISKRMKAIRFSLINIPARVLERSRSLLVRLCRGHPSLKLLLEMRHKISMLVPASL